MRMSEDTEAAFDLQFHQNLDDAIKGLNSILSSDEALEDVFGYRIQRVLLECAEDNINTALPVLILETEYGKTGWFENSSLAACCLFAINNDDSVRTGVVTSKDIISKIYTEGEVYEYVSKMLRDRQGIVGEDSRSEWYVELGEFYELLTKGN